MKIKSLGAVAALMLACGLRSDAQPAPSRSWTDATGRKVEAAFGGVQGDNVLLKMADGKTIPFAIARLSAADQDFIKTQSAPAPATNGSGEPAKSRASAVERLPIEKRTFPERVEVSAASIDANPVTEIPAERKFIYQTETFEFSSQAKLAKSVMTEVAQTFESTRLLLSQLPWGLDCRPPEGFERYQAKLFETRNDYIQAGGPENSGGVYMGALKVFMVPFPSLGLEKRGQTYFKNKNFRNDTLVHEVTHQIMDDYLSFLPKWMIEGTAEYTEMLPDTANGFLPRQNGSGMKDYIKEGEKRLGAVEIPNLQEHMTMTRDQWDGLTGTSSSMFTLYFRSCLIVYYFNHLDDDGKGTRFMKYMDAVYGEVSAMREFFKNPAVKRTPDGRFSYPSSLKPPDFRNPFKHIDLLLDGRSYSELAKQIGEKYKTMGVKVKAS
jgi:SLA1 homology domain 1, SHD1